MEHVPGKVPVLAQTPQKESILDQGIAIAARALADNECGKEMDHHHQGGGGIFQRLNPGESTAVVLVAAGREHGVEEGFFGGEVFEEQRFRNARGDGQLPRRGAVKALFREDAPHGVEQVDEVFLFGALIWAEIAVVFSGEGVAEIIFQQTGRPDDEWAVAYVGQNVQFMSDKIDYYVYAKLMTTSDTDLMLPGTRTPIAGLGNFQPTDEQINP